MTVLVTIMKSSMKGKDGYISVQDSDVHNYSNIGLYIFNKCIKVKTPKPISKWLCYWEGLPFAVEYTVQSEKLCTGYLQVTVLDHKVLDISVIGEYNSKRNHFVKVDKTYTKALMKTNDILDAVNTVKKVKPKSTKGNENTLSTEEAEKKIQMIAEAWGIKRKSR